MTLATPDQNKRIYAGLHDRIFDKRFTSDKSIRRYAHHSQYQIFLDCIPPGSSVLDAGCGDGVLSILLARHGCRVTGIDISHPNIEAAKAYAANEGVSDHVTFLVGDAEHLPVPDQSFDYVVSSHVLEHLPSFIAGAAELSRIARTQVIIAIPTCLSLGALSLLAGDKYWTLSRRSLYAVPVGFFRVLAALLTGREGVNESYADHTELIHIWRFPWRGKALIQQGQLKVLHYGASAYVIPYLPFLVPLCRWLHRFRWLPVFRQFGHGTTYVCQPSRDAS